MNNMEITYRHGYSGDVIYTIDKVEFLMSATLPYFKLTVIDTPNHILYATSFYHEKGKKVFDCPENF